MRVNLWSQGWESNLLIGTKTDFPPWFQEKRRNWVFVKLILQDTYNEPSKIAQNENQIHKYNAASRIYSTNCNSIEHSIFMHFEMDFFQTSYFVNLTQFHITKNCARFSEHLPNLTTDRLHPGGSDHENFLDQIGCSWKFPEIFDDGAPHL